MKKNRSLAGFASIRPVIKFPMRVRNCPCQNWNTSCYYILQVSPGGFSQKSSYLQPSGKKNRWIRIMRCAVSYPASAGNCERLRQKNISRLCGELDTNLWMSQGSETLGCFIWKIIKTAKIAKIAEVLKTLSICVIPLFSFHRMEDLIYLSRLTVCSRLSDCCRHFILGGLPIDNRGEQNS